MTWMTPLDAITTVHRPRLRTRGAARLGTARVRLALRGRGWRILYLGSDTPLPSVADAAHTSDAKFVVISAVSSKRFRAHDDELRELARTQRLCLGGAGAAVPSKKPSA